MRNTYRLMLALLVAISFFAGTAYLVKTYAAEHVSPRRLRAAAASFGPAAPVAFVAFYAVGPLLLFPATVLNASAGLLWSWKTAVLLTVLGSNACANLGFWIGRALGQHRVQKWIPRRFHHHDKRLSEAGVRTIALLRILPIMPFSALSLLASVSSVRWKDYALGSFLGMLPGSIGYATLMSFLDW
jgi:uncharacterized membrane protein YdjX (TVP38/TMEM64 family)